MDVHDKITRSYNVSQIKGKNTKPEMLVPKLLFNSLFETIQRQIMEIE
jgi:DNA mismatch endonuclease (patch repair protein)